MPLTANQLTTLKNDIAANTATILVASVSTQIKDVAHNPDLAPDVVSWYNTTASPDFFGNYRNVPLDTIKANITHKNYTPTDAVPASGSTVQVTNDLLVHLGRTMFAGAFQMAINNILLAGTVFDATNANLVGALKDATNTDMPTGANGASRKGGWSTIQTIICRKGTRAEKLFADTSGGNGAANTTAATFTFEGSLTGTDIVNAWNS